MSNHRELLDKIEWEGGLYELATSYGLVELDPAEFADVHEDIRLSYKDLAHRAQLLSEDISSLMAVIEDHANDEYEKLDDAARAEMGDEEE